MFCTSQAAYMAGATYLKKIFIVIFELRHFIIEGAMSLLDSGPSNLFIILSSLRKR